MTKTVQIQTVAKCNARCKICPYSTSMLAKCGDVMEQKVFDRILSELHKHKVKIPKLPLYMQAEPLLDPYLFERIQQARKMLGAQVGHLELSTNAGLLTEDRGAKLLEALDGFQASVWLSFHGTNAEDFEDMTGLRYNVVLGNIKRFLSMSDGRLRLGRKIMTCGDKKTCNRFWLGICKDLGLRNRPTVKVFVPNNRGGNISSSKQSRSTKLDCVRLSKWLHFNWKGDLIICCNDYENEVVFGNIMQTDLRTLIAGIPGRIRELSKSKDFICWRCDKRYK